VDTKNPLVTVGIPLYNHERYIVECVRSVFEQTYSPIELIVIDDGSNDRSYSVIKEYLDSDACSNRDIAVNLQTQVNQGMCNTLNAIAKDARGKYITFLGSDDYWLPEKLQDQVRFLENHPDITLVHSNSIKIDSSGNQLKVIDYSAKENCGYLFEALVTRTGGINTPSHLYRRSIYEEIGYYDPAYSFEDTDFWLRLTREHAVGFINKIHTAYRWHGENLSQSGNALKFYNEELISIYRKNIQDPNLLKIALLKIYQKSCVKALKILNISRALEYARRYFRLRYETH